MRELNRQCGDLVLVGRLKIWFQVVEFVPHTESTSQNHCAQLFFQRPWQVVRTDLFYSQSVDYLLAVDYFSRYVEVAVLRKNKTASEIIRALKAIFARNGIIEKVRSDNGPRYDSQEHSHFAREWRFQIAQVPPGMPSQTVRHRELYRIS